MITSFQSAKALQRQVTERQWFLTTGTITLSTTLIKHMRETLCFPKFTNPWFLPQQRKS